ncbi:LAQU0S04e01618g1_1 [Lachancea quebecensis]|uniref:Ubiquitin carboxyl-terminal hydrolase 2 n=1 Tax=Lachancea quebecensis TaxID=1654605 RepID=A0A0P1KQ62_9SACH|nr:LAQU0S04e01618g1_1 [Lachancea quebecensis]
MDMTFNWMLESSIAQKQRSAMFKDFSDPETPAYEPGDPIPKLIDDNSQRDDGSTEDNGKTLLYPDAGSLFPFKTSERLLDEIKAELAYRNSDRHDILYSALHNGVLKLPILEYSRKPVSDPFSIGHLLDQVVLKTRYEYESRTCPGFNKVTVFMGVLVNAFNVPRKPEDLATAPIYHLKLTIKTRTYLEHTRKQAGVCQYHLISELHPSDKQDLFLAEESDPSLLDSAMYVSSDTNKLICIEIFKPEFSQDDIATFSPDSIRRRFVEACEKFPDLDPEKVPSQAECFSTLLKIFKGPLNRRSPDDVLKTISADNKFLNSQIDPIWLTERFQFQLCETQNLEESETTLEYQPPDLTDYVSNLSVRKLREEYTRKCLELVFLGKMAVALMSKDEVAQDSRARSFHLYQASYSPSFFFHLLGETRGVMDYGTQEIDKNYHFINLSSCHYYSDRDIIKNYETQTRLDPENLGIYFDALNYIANSKGSYQLLTFCRKQDVVGKEALDSALSLFGIDASDTDLATMPDDLLLGIYRKESNQASQQKHSSLKNSLRLIAKAKKSQVLQFYTAYEPYDNAHQAYSLLEINESVDVDIIQTAYTVKVADSPGLKIDCDRAIYTIAVSRRSMPLFNFLVEQCPAFNEFYSADKLTYQEALNLLQVNENASDDVILEVFQRKWNQEPVSSPDQFLISSSALTKVGQVRNSLLINRYLETGIIDVSCLPAGNWPTGLNNIGNTCYLNSLLQYYFCISPLRQSIIEYQKTLSEFHQSLGHLENKRRIGGREVSETEVERSIQFVYQLRDLFTDMVHTENRYVTPTKELAYLAFAPSNIEVEFEGTPTSSTVEEKEKEEGYREEEGEVKETTEVIDLTAGPATEQDVEMVDPVVPEPEMVVEQIVDSSKIDNKMETMRAIGTSTRVAKISSDQLENALEMGRQQDVTECIGNVLFQLESASEPTCLDTDGEQQDLIKQLFFGKLRQVLTPLNGPTKVRTKIERFVSLLVNVGDHPKDVYDALDQYFKNDVLELEDGDVKRSVAIKELPAVLQIQIQRVYYDRERFMPFKSIEPLPFEDSIYMDRYMDTEDRAMLEKREEATTLKKELLMLKEKQRSLLDKNGSGMSYKSSLLETKRFLQADILEKNEIECPNKEKAIHAIDSMLLKIDEELANIYHRIISLEQKLSTHFDDFKKEGYSLFAVFIHRGEASYGHYWIYIKDSGKNGIWRKYNDESVTEAPDSEVFNFSEGNTATPYFLVYIKNGQESQIEPLHRVIPSCSS